MRLALAAADTRVAPECLVQPSNPWRPQSDIAAHRGGGPSDARGAKMAQIKRASGFDPAPLWCKFRG